MGVFEMNEASEKHVVLNGMEGTESPLHHELHNEKSMDSSFKQIAEMIKANDEAINDITKRFQKMFSAMDRCTREDVCGGLTHEMTNDKAKYPLYHLLANA